MDFLPLMAFLTHSHSCQPLTFQVTQRAEPFLAPGGEEIPAAPCELRCQDMIVTTKATDAVAAGATAAAAGTRTPMQSSRRC